MFGTSRAWGGVYIFLLGGKGWFLEGFLLWGVEGWVLPGWKWGLNYTSGSQDRGSNY